MKTYSFFLFFLFANITTACAQYCCTEKGTVFHYITNDIKENKIFKDSLSVQNVVDKNGRTIVELVGYGESYTPRDVREGNNRETFVYRKKEDITDYIILNSETENELIRQYIASGYLAGQEAEAEKEYQAYRKFMRADGQINIPIKANAKANEQIPTCRYTYKMGIFKAKAILKGTYRGIEIVHTPAGDFECVRIQTQCKNKILLSAHKEYNEYWYAQGIGLVKTESYSKRGKLLSSTLLQAIKRCNIVPATTLRERDTALLPNI